jgi:predicted phosphoadenosine phosphosulfate sulfurtransferase
MSPIQLFLPECNPSSRANKHVSLFRHYLSINMTWKQTLGPLASWLKADSQVARLILGKQNTSHLTRFQGHHNRYAIKTINFGKATLNVFIQ